jgi:5'(3')-deoxyribonucleotidase
MTKATYWDMDGVLANFHKAYATNKGVALNRKAMAELEPFTENVNTLRALIAAGTTCYILTKAANDNGAAGKVDWLRKYVPAMDAEHFICIYKGRKVDNIREDGILIDDDMTNIKQWIKAGHKAIHVEVKGGKVEL